MPGPSFRYRILNFLILMGTMWILAGLAMSPRKPVWGLALALVCALLLLVAGRRHKGKLSQAQEGEGASPDAAAQGRDEFAWWRRITIAEFAFVFIAAWAAESHGRVDLVLAGIATVVAIHFWALAVAFRRRKILARRFAVEGALMLMLIAAAVVSISAAWRNLVIGIGMGVIIWLSALLTLAGRSG